MDSVALVREFELACGATLPTIPTQPPVEKLKLRLSLELEELYEKAQAMGLEGSFQTLMFQRLRKKECFLISSEGDENTCTVLLNADPDVEEDYDQVALLDACCDQRYVQDGTVLTCGLQDIFYLAFAEVQRSNMSKFATTMDEAAQTSVFYKNNGVETTWGASGPHWVIKRAEDGKILKSVNYSPANLEPFFHDQSIKETSSGTDVPEAPKTLEG